MIIVAMMGNVIAVVLGIAAIVVYLKGAKYDKPWATPVLILLVLGALAAVIIPQTGAGRRMRYGRVSNFPGLEMIGRELRRDIPSGARLIILREPGAEEMAWDGEWSEDAMPSREELLEAHKRELKDVFDGAAGTNAVIVASIAPGEEWMPVSDARAFNDAIRPYSDENIDVVISLVGLPRDERTGTSQLEQLVCFDWEPRPMFAADAGINYDPGVLRGYINEGILRAVVLFPSVTEPGRIVVGPDNIGDLPATAPTGRVR